MNKQAQQNLTEGPILPVLTRLALPILGSSFMQMLYNLTDIFWLGRLSAESMAGAGMGGFILWLIASLGGLPRSAGLIMSSNAKGAEDEAEVKRVASLTLFWTLILGLFASFALMFGAKAIVGLFRMKDPLTLSEGISYIRICGAGSIFVLLVPVLTALSIGWGNSRTPFWASLMGVVINIVLDPIFIFGFNMGASGAAWATVIANAAGTCLLLWKFAPAFKGFTHFKNYLDRTRRFMALGLPQCLEGLGYAGFSMMVGTLLGGFGPAVLAANSMGAQVESVTWMVALGLSSAATSFCGQNWGARRFERIQKGFTSVMILTTLYASAIGIAFWVFPSHVARIFSDQPNVIARSNEYFVILAVSQPFMALEIAIAGCFRGIQKPGFPALVSIIITMARWPLAALAIQSGAGYQTVWWIISLSSVAKGLIITLSFTPAFRRQVKAFESEA